MSLLPFVFKINPLSKNTNILYVNENYFLIVVLNSKNYYVRIYIYQEIKQMKIYSNNTQTNVSNNFKGTFILNTKNQTVKNAIPDIIKKGRQLFYNIKNDGDIVLVTKDKYDKKVYEFINNEKIQFSYYPEISTKSGLDDEIPSKLKKLLNINNNCIINNPALLSKFLSNNKKLHLSKQSEYLQEAINTLRLNIEKLKIDINEKGIFVIRDADKHRTIKSTGFRGGMSYVFVIPDALYEASRRVLIGKNGKEIVKEYTTPNEMLEFNKKFQKFVEL